MNNRGKHKRSVSGQFIKSEENYIALICQTCKIEFKVYKSELKYRKRKFCSKKCSGQSQIGRKVTWHRMGPLPQIQGKNHYNWSGGRVKTTDGYIAIYFPKHPYATKPRGYVREHRLVMEQSLGRYLDPKEVIHHIDRDRTNNELSNLLLLPNEDAHRRVHAERRDRNGQFATV